MAQIAVSHPFSCVWEPLVPCLHCMLLIASALPMWTLICPSAANIFQDILPYIPSLVCLIYYFTNLLSSIYRWLITYKDSLVGYKIISSDSSVSVSFEKDFTILKFNTENIFLSLTDSYIFFYFLKKMINYLYLIIKEKDQNTKSNSAMTVSPALLPEGIQHPRRDAGAPRLVFGHLSIQDTFHPHSPPIPKSSLSSSSTPHLFCLPHTSCPHASTAVFHLFPGSHAHLLPQLFFISIPFPPHRSFCLCSCHTSVH